MSIAAAASRTKSRVTAGFAVTCIIISVMGLVTALLPPGHASAGEDGTASFSWGFRERIRQSYLRNGFDLSDDNADDRNFFRFRTQLWADWMPAEGVRLHLGLNNEHRHWLKSERGYEDEDFEIDELIVENLYIALDRVGGTRFSITAGRQNIRYGEGFLMLDGGPVDGSRTGYFNAVRVKGKWEKRSVEIHALRDPSWDHYMPVLNTQYRRLIEWDETGAGAYYIDDSFEGKRLEAYYFYKNEKHEDDLRPESDIHTIGARVTGSFREDMPWAAEFAFQAGDRGEASRMAYGGYAYAGWRSKLRFEPSVTAGLVYLSGDDPATEEYEGWDPLYSRWPKWSDLLIYTFAPNGRGVAWWDNLLAPNLQISASPGDRFSLSGKFYYMIAPQNDWASVLAGKIVMNTLEGEGDTKGFLSVIRFNWKYTEYLSGHLLWEYFAPGDYYRDDLDAAHFLRYELMFTY